MFAFFFLHLGITNTLVSGLQELSNRLNEDDLKRKEALKTLNTNIHIGQYEPVVLNTGMRYEKLSSCYIISSVCIISN